MSAPTPEPTQTDVRTTERHECFLEVALGDNKKVFRPASVLDLSAGGIKLLAEPPPAPGDTLNLTFLTDDGRLFQILATVVHYVEHGKTWAVGCRFARELDEKELVAILQ
jgi:hypothetical protein